ASALMAHINADLERKVRERTARLQETVTELEHFSYTITHDMRAPLRAMRGLGSLLAEECADSMNPAQQDYVRRIAEAANRMDMLITDALNYSRFAHHDLELEPVNHGELLRGILESYPQFQPPHARVEVNCHVPVTLGNLAAMLQCFSNLLSNAVKFVPPDRTPEIRVWDEPRDDFVRLWFEDNGIGIDPRYQDKIWLMFEQINQAYEGTGIGLALVRKVVERMGGRVGVESEPGRGSRFWVDLRRVASGLQPSRQAA
ncbi:MAG TPA: HAMP domain-containing sensor histidine kinase, partial [Clostridia bacterium]|nr:HAMP domain-containing sensor histidine kinase [Clostridia bacterium]